MPDDLSINQDEIISSYIFELDATTILKPWSNLGNP